MRLEQHLCLDDFERSAAARLPQSLFAYVHGGAETMRSLEGNRSIFDEYEFVPRVLLDVSARTSSRTLFGQFFAAPFGIAPVGLSGLMGWEADIAYARVAAARQIPMILSGSSLVPLEEVAAAYPQAWFQAYIPGDELSILPLLDRVKRAGYATLVITADTAVPGNREGDTRAGFRTPIRPSFQLLLQGLMHPRWVIRTLLRTLLVRGMPHFENNAATRGAPAISSRAVRDFSGRERLTWGHLELVRRHWEGKLVLKGVLDTGDAHRARTLGVDGIILSNHGGRQLDGAIHPLRVLPEIVDACPDLPVMIDSGFRRGTDVIKALALGASFVFAGRPFCFAAAVSGEAGVLRAVDLLQAEVLRTMALLGISRLAELEGCGHVREANLAPVRAARRAPLRKLANQ